LPPKDEITHEEAIKCLFAWQDLFKTPVKKCVYYLLDRETFDEKLYKNQVAQADQKSRPIRFRNELCYEALYYIVQFCTRGERVLPFKKCPSRQFIDDMLYVLDEDDALQLRKSSGIANRTIDADISQRVYFKTIIKSGINLDQQECVDFISKLMPSTMNIFLGDKNSGANNEKKFLYELIEKTAKLLSYTTAVTNINHAYLDLHRKLLKKKEDLQGTIAGSSIKDDEAAKLLHTAHDLYNRAPTLVTYYNCRQSFMDICRKIIPPDHTDRDTITRNLRLHGFEAQLDTLV